MGKGVLIGAIALSFITILTFMNRQDSARETEETQYEFQTGLMAKELAMRGRKLVLSSWLRSGGATATDVSANMDGGTITVLNDSVKDLSGSEISFTVRGVYDGAVHDVTSRFKWKDLTMTPLQMKTPNLAFTVSPLANLTNMNTILLDDQPLEDLEEILVSDLGLIGSLSEINLGMSFLQDEVEDELAAAHSHINVDPLTQAERTMIEQQGNGLFSPDQVLQMINNYIHVNPGSEQVVSDVMSLPGTFGVTGPTVLRIQDDAVLSGNLTGRGVLIVEGDLTVPEDVSLNWTGIVVVAPPSDDLLGSVDFIGTVNIDGGLVVLQESMPTTGHMDLTINYDLLGNWYNGWGTQFRWWWHTHDYSGNYGTQVGFLSNQPGFIVHSTQTKFSSLLNFFAFSDELVFELHNPQSHGLSTLTFDVAGTGLTASSVAAGFDPAIAESPTSKYRTRPISKSDIRHLDISVNRISKLKKLFDNGQPYPGCSDPYNSGAHCVALTYNRYGALALRIYRYNAGVETHVYDASLYWHRLTSEEEEFNNEMNDLYNDIQNGNYGVSINLGDNTTLSSSTAASGILGAFAGGSGAGILNLGTWHRHWEANDPDNPLNLYP